MDIYFDSADLLFSRKIFSLSQTRVFFPTPSLLLFPRGQDDGIKDCINQGLSERDSSSRLAKGGCRRVATPWFEEEE